MCLKCSMRLASLNKEKESLNNKIAKNASKQAMALSN